MRNPDNGVVRRMLYIHLMASSPKTMINGAIARPLTSWYWFGTVVERTGPLDHYAGLVDQYEEPCGVGSLLKNLRCSCLESRF